MNCIGIVLLLFMAGCQTSTIELVDFDRGIGYVDLVNADRIEIYCDEELYDLCTYFIINSNNSAEFIEGVSVNEYDARLFEIAYESYNLPIIESKANWIKVLYPIGNHQYRYGYLKKEDRTIKTVYWHAHLVEKALFFNSDSSFKLFKSIDGEVIPLDTSNPEDYVLWPQAINGLWMNVKFISPSDNCVNRVTSEIINCWIKYLDENGRPLVWYYPRGC